MFEVKKKRNLDGELKFRVPQEIEDQYRMLRAKDYEVQEKLREFAVKLIEDLSKAEEEV